jgi:hypothetical protein
MHCIAQSFHSDMVTMLGVAAAKQWLHQLRATKPDKVSKCFRTVVSRHISPLFVVLQQLIVLLRQTLWHVHAKMLHEGLGTAHLPTDLSFPQT